jgi:hypothetical protein
MAGPRAGRPPTGRHKRLESAYVEMLQVVERAGTWASRLAMSVDVFPQRPLPNLPSADGQRICHLCHV